ncbi:hypothetical protein ACJJTC_005192 [Scirpophaga incertulas]
MYTLYVEKCNQPVKEAIYRKVFNEQFNLSFHKPKKDVCDLFLENVTIKHPTQTLTQKKIKDIRSTYKYMGSEDKAFMEALINKVLCTEPGNNPPTPESEIFNEDVVENDDRSKPAPTTPYLETIPRRKKKKPIELQEAGKSLKEAMSSLNKVLNKPIVPEDDFDRYGKFLANKLRKLSVQTSRFDNVIQILSDEMFSPPTAIVNQAFYDA